MFKTTYNSNEKLWSGQKRSPIFNPQSNLGEIILKVLETTPDRVTQVSDDTGAEVTCFEMKSRIIKISNYFKKIDLEIGDTISILACNSEYLTSLLFAGFTMGLKVNFLSTQFLEDDIIYVCTFIKSKVIFCDDNFVDIVQKCVDKMEIKPKIVTLLKKVEDYENLEDIVGKSDFDEDFECPILEDAGQTIALLTCTSGTTGPPKVVNITHSQLICHMIPFWKVSTTGDILFTFFNCYWTIGPMFMIIGTLYGLKRVMTKSEFNPELCVEIFNKHKVTATFMGGNLFVALSKAKNLKPMPSMKNLILGGSRLPKNLAKPMVEFFPNGHINYGYGASENGGSVVAVSVGRLDNVGNLCHEMEVKIIDDDGNRLGPNQEGEVCFKGSSPNLGYYNNPEATSQTLDKEGFIHSGDLGYFDGENLLHIIDRKKDTIKNNAYQIAPAVIENIIFELESVENCCVVGIYDGLRHDIICAFVKRKDKSLTEEDVSNYVNDQVAEYKKIKGVFFIDEFPVTISGKIIRRKLKETGEALLRQSKPQLFYPYE